MKIVPLFVVMLVAAQGFAVADEQASLTVRMDDQVVYCVSQMKHSDGEFAHALKDGIPVATIWNIKVKQRRDYWTDESIAEIRVIRRAVPDLLSRSWLLVDEASGISRRVYSMQESITFLAGLDSFPVLDRSLLVQGSTYLMGVSVELHTGEINDAWWYGLWDFNETSMVKAFTLP